MSDPALFDRALILARKRRAAALGGDSAAFLLDRVAEDLSDRLSLIRRTFPAAVNLGAFDGTLSRALRALPGVGLLIDAEPSPELLARAAGPRVVADEELLPFRSGSLDLVVSGLSLQLVNDVPGALLQIRRALKPDGLFLAAVLGARSLEELREAFLVAES